MIAGPTAVGKTAVGVSLARRLDGEIISCDSMQVYQGLAVASNQPTAEEREAVIHHLIGTVPLTESFDAASFAEAAYRCLAEISDRGRLPIIVGGTGMYMKVLLDGIFESQEVPEEIREQLEQEAARKGSSVLYEQLKVIDPQAADRIHPHDTRRIIRALEIYRLTGEPISALQRQTDGLWGKRPVFLFGLAMDRQRLYQRINDRVETMFAQGLVDEIRSIRQMDLSKTARAVIGLKEVGAFLDGQCSLDEAKEEMKKNTRHLAKRQMTWFRADERIQWMDVGRQDDAENVAGRIEKIVRGEKDAG